MATTSEVEICNLALGELGVDPITSLTDDTSKRAQECNRKYGPSRDSILQSHDWHWARKRVALNLETATPAFGFSYQYSLPVDFLKVVETSPEGMTFKITGNVLECNETAVKILYVARITDPSAFSPLFVDALTFKLAERMAKSLTGDLNLKQIMQGRYNELFGMSANRDSTSDTPVEYRSDNLLVVRW